MSVQFEGYERRIAKIEKALKEYGIESLEAARDLCLSKGVNVEEIVKGVQPLSLIHICNISLIPSSQDLGQYFILL